MTKDCRLSVRITNDLDAWLEAEGHKRGLDKAAFARMALFERMNGAPTYGVSPAMSAVRELAIAPPTRDILDLASVQEHIAQEEADAGYEQSENDAIDVDDLVNSSFAQAEEQGLTNPVEREPSPEQIGGVRAIVRPPARYSAANQPGWINQQ